jgi:DNA-binding response OmpR family regulator
VRHLRERWPRSPIVCVAITASGLLRQRSVYLDAGFDDFIGKPFLFETVWDCMARHLHLDLDHDRVAEAPAGAAPQTADIAAVRLPEALRERLLAAAEINALTEIEALIGELKRLDPAARSLADELEGLLAQYDTDGITARVSRTRGAGGDA